MGLDQNAFSTEQELTPDNYKDTMNNIESQFYWRKHARLQNALEGLLEAELIPTVFPLESDNICNVGGTKYWNCNPVKLDVPTIHNLKQWIMEGLDEGDGGFFYGSQYSAESAAEYKDQDMAFCNWALSEIDAGKHVYYDCWW